MALENDFKDSWTCKCGALNGKQDIRTATDGRIYRICNSCSCTIDVCIPAHDIISHRYVNKCCGLRRSIPRTGCNCTAYQPVRGFECRCGHHGSIHRIASIPYKTGTVNTKVKKSELKDSGLSFDINSVDDLQ
ncbi:predicted protein [Naegleria gruberi]|uniref:Predicted protein n=1 Tax=Naegleria gruberi TaxID=5762 RepID=D2VL94_NAEGR|nr:uncharacterized protein NAEGRDRAFT_69701 [Naegleria gruberi]EFC42272.1 predicted protein [Naegleria gruberi]|eukprot:XP_002675016.1 predicted protein [Naegleria gruberi strain NEG-M]